jgi:hypothetical protein
MNDRNFDQLLDAWLDAGPTVAPGRVTEAVRLEIRSTRQSHGVFEWQPRRFPVMNNSLRFALATAVLAVAALLGFNYLVAPNIGGPGLGDPTPSPSPAVVTFTSDRHGYSIEHPADWLVVEQPGSVNLTGMEIGSAGTDLIAPPEHSRSGSEDGVVVVSAHELLDGESLADFAERVSREAACGTSFGIREARLGGEQAQSRGRECDYWEWIEVTAIHGGRGYVVWAVSTTGPTPRDRPINDQFLESFRFTD